MSTAFLVCRSCQVCEFAIAVHLRVCSSEECLLCYRALGCCKSMNICCIIFELLKHYTTGFAIHIKCNIFVRGPEWRKSKLSYLEATSVRPSVTLCQSVAVYELLYRQVSESREVPALRFSDSPALPVGSSKSVLLQAWSGPKGSRKLRA